MPNDGRAGVADIPYCRERVTSILIHFWTFHDQNKAFVLPIA